MHSISRHSHIQSCYDRKGSFDGSHYNPLVKRPLAIYDLKSTAVEVHPVPWYMGLISLISICDFVRIMKLEVPFKGVSILQINMPEFWKNYGLAFFIDPKNVISRYHQTIQFIYNNF